MEHEGKTYDASYVFSSEQQAEVKAIYQKYSHSEENRQALSAEEEKMAELRRLDRSVTRSGAYAALSAGLGGAVIHGIGTALIQNETMFVLGTVIAVAGLLLFLSAYPIHNHVVTMRRRKVEAQILKLCRELMK